MIDFDPATGRAIVSHRVELNDEPREQALLDARGLLTSWQHSRLFFWGPREVLGEVREVVGNLVYHRYTVCDQQGHPLRPLAGEYAQYFAEAGLLVLREYGTAPTGTWVLDLHTGGIRWQLPGTWHVEPASLVGTARPARPSSALAAAGER